MGVMSKLQACSSSVHGMMGNNNSLLQIAGSRICSSCSSGSYPSGVTASAHLSTCEVRWAGMSSPAAGLLSHSPSLCRGASGAFRTLKSSPRAWIRRLWWTAALIGGLLWLSLQLAVSHQHESSGQHIAAPKFWQYTTTTVPVSTRRTEAPPLPPAAYPDFQQEDSICANNSKKCAALNQAKETSLNAFRLQQLASALNVEDEKPQALLHSLSATTTLSKKRKGFQAFQLLTGPFRRGPTLPECAALERIAPRLRTIAIVGNGPLSVQQRQQIQQADVVIRFNKLDNRFCGERLDVWVVRFGNETRSGYHGIHEVIHCTTAEAVGQLSSLWFLDSEPGFARQNAISKIIQTFTEDGWMAGKTWLGIDKRPFTEEFHRTMDNTTTPSSGWIGLRMAERCRPWGARIHLFGYNWSPLAWSGHKMSEEQQYARALEAEGKLVIHKPPCGGFRTCDGCTVVAGYDARNKRLACAENALGP